MKNELVSLEQDILKKWVALAGFESGTLRLQNMRLTPRPRVIIKRDGGKYNMNQVLKSAATVGNIIRAKC